MMRMGRLPSTPDAPVMSVSSYIRRISDRLAQLRKFHTDSFDDTGQPVGNSLLTCFFFFFFLAGKDN